MKPEQFKTMISLTKVQPWLEMRIDALYNLLYRDCLTEEHRELVVSMLSRFMHISNDKYDHLINGLIDNISNLVHHESVNTQIVAMAASTNTDSSHEIIYKLKGALPPRGWQKAKLVNRCSHALRTYKANPDYKNIVLVDEFIGSGQTVNNMVSFIRKQFEDAKISDYNLSVEVLVSTKFAIKKLASLGIKVRSQITIDKGLSDFYGEELEQKILDYLEIESLLSESYMEHKLPSLGFNRAEALYCRNNTNTPNSVFPIFWWCRYRNGDQRETVLFRDLDE